MTPLKIYGLLLIVIGIPLGRTALDDLLPTSYWLAAGLCMIFFGPERVNDERVQQLKMKALFTAMSLGLGLTFLAYIVLFTLFPAQKPAPHRLHEVITAWDFLAGVLLLSLAVFYFHRWLDSRPAVEKADATDATFEQAGMKFHRAPWSSELKWLSTLFTVILLGVAAVFVRRGGWTGWLPAVGFVILVIIPALFMIRAYAVKEGILVVRRLGWSTRLPLTGLVSVTVEPEAMRDSTRTFGNGGAFAYTGYFNNPRLGSFRAYVTDPARCVVLRWADRTVVVSPAAPEAFVQELPAAKGQP